MENEKQIEKIERFLKEVVIRDLEKLQEADLSYMHFVLMGQTIEVLGGFLDRKPMKAEGQSSRRFAAGVKYLFGGRYRLLNENNFLYDTLRNQMTHTFIPARNLCLVNEKGETVKARHLSVKEGRLTLVSSVFYEDICRACDRLLVILKEGHVKPKNIAFGDEE